MEPLQLARPQGDDRLMERLALEIVRRRLATPAILFLESVRPLNFVGSQMLTFLDPLVRVFAHTSDLPRLAHLLEERDAIERFILAIEAAQESAAHD